MLPSHSRSIEIVNNDIFIAEDNSADKLTVAPLIETMDKSEKWLVADNRIYSRIGKVRYLE